MVDPAYGHAFASAITGARLHIIAGAGHLPQLEGHHGPGQILERVEYALKNEIAPALLLDGAGIEVLEVTDGVASVRLTGACAGCRGGGRGASLHSS